MLKVAVIGATGYTGEELLRVLAFHPSVEITYVSGKEERSKRIQEIFPYLRGVLDLECRSLNPEEAANKADIFFLSLPHTVSMRHAAFFLSKGKRVIDISADYRFKDAQVYQKYYGVIHNDPSNLQEAVYGLTEWNREALGDAKLIANPGCYPTGALLGILPVIKRNLQIEQPVIIDAKSGVTGAGRKASKDLLAGELQENFKAYKVLRHQHEPEIRIHSGSEETQIVFVPHLLNVRRGILSTIYFRLKMAQDAESLHEIFQSYYKKERFVTVLEPGEFPELQYVQRTNQCHIGLAVDERKRTAVVVTAIDNLMKGAAGQAVQNMNVSMGLNESDGLV